MKSLWGDLPNGDDITPPVSILKAQADMLTAHYRGNINGDIRPARTPLGEFRYNLSIIAPNLNDYTYLVATLINPITLYPCRLIDNAVNKSYEVKTAVELEGALGAILSSDNTKRVLAALIAQSRV
jgi:hypothetical protein